MGYGGGQFNRDHGIHSAKSTSGGRAKAVVSPDEIPHLWYHQTQDQARSSNGSIYFKGESLWSYGEHLCMARHIECHGVKGVLLHYRHNTVTTNRHLGYVKQAIPRDVPVFKVARPEDSPERNLRSMVGEMGASLTTLRMLMKETRKAKARITACFHTLSRDWDSFVALASFCGNPDKLSTSWPELWEANELQSVVDIVTIYEAAQRDRATKRALGTIDPVKIAEKVTNWRAGAHINGVSELPTMLRVKGENVETSRGAVVPLEHVRKVLPRVLFMSSRCVEQNSDWVPPVAMRLGHYSLSKIMANGAVVIGCHIIPRDEAIRLSGLIGPLPPVAYGEIMNDESAGE